MTQLKKLSVLYDKISLSLTETARFIFLHKMRQEKYILIAFSEYKSGIIIVRSLFF